MEYDIEKILQTYEDDYNPDPRPMDQGPRNNYLGGGKVLQLLKNFNKTGAVKGLEEKLIKQYKSEGMGFIEAIKKAQTEASGVRYEGRMKIINNAMKETDVYSDDYVDLLDMKIKLEDPDFAKQYVNFSDNLKNKTRSRHDPDWAEANFGEEYGTKLDQARVKEINESIDPNITERSLVDDIDDMNIANTDEFFGRKKNSEGGRIGFNEAGPVNKPGAWKTAKKNLLNRYVEGLPEGYLEDYMKLFLNDRGDGTFSKKASVEEGVAKMKEKYDDILKTQYSSRQTNKSGKKFLDARVIDINSSILQDLKSKGSIVSGSPDAKKIRTDDLEIVGDIRAKTPTGKNIHHFMPLAGIEGEPINLSSTKNTAVIDRKLNYDMSPFDKKLKANQKEQIQLLKEKPPGYEKRMEELNYKAKNIYKEAGKKLPASKGYLGYTQINVNPDGTYNSKVIGMDKNKSLAGLDGEEIFYKNISKEDKVKVRSLIETVKEANPELAKKVEIRLNGGLPLDDIMSELKKIPGLEKTARGLTSGFMKAGGPFEVGFVGLDMFNELSKGKTGKQAFKTAVSNLTFGAYEGGKREDMRTLIETAKNLNIDSTGFNELKELIDLEKKLATEKVNLQKTFQYGMDERSVKKYKDMVDKLQNEFDSKSKALKEGDFDSLINNYTKTTRSLAEQQFEKSKQTKLNSVDPSSGTLGNAIYSALDYKNYLPQNFLQNSITGAIPDTLSKIPVVGSIFKPTSDTAKLFKMSKEDKIKKLDKAKPGIISETQQTFYADGGLAGLMKKYYD